MNATNLLFMFKHLQHVDNEIMLAFRSFGAMSMNFTRVKPRRIPAGAAFRSCGQVLDRVLSSQMCCCTCWCILVDMLHPCCRKKVFKIQIWAMDDKVAHCLTHTHLSPKYHKLVVKKIMITKSLRNPLKNFANACHEEVLNSSWPNFLLCKCTKTGVLVASPYPP